MYTKIKHQSIKVAQENRRLVVGKYSMVQDEPDEMRGSINEVILSNVGSINMSQFGKFMESW
jgi:hypothetical protein